MFNIPNQIYLKVKHPNLRKRNYLELNKKDFALLLFLENHRVAARTQLHTLLTQFYGECSNIRTFNNRWDKFEEFNLIDSKILILNKAGAKRKVIRLSTKGIELLKEMKLLPEDYNDSALLQVFGKSKWDHTLAIREMVVRGLVGLKEIQEDIDKKEDFTYEKVESLNPHYHTFVHPEEGTTIVMPDWLLRFQNTVACIEVDSGSESLQTIQQKIANYLTIATLYPDIKFTVVIGIIDDSFATQRFYGDDRSTRVANMKEMIIERNPTVFNSPLEVNVCSLSRTSFVLPSSIALVPMNAEFRGKRMGLAQRMIKRLEGYPYQHELVENAEDLLDRIEKSMGARPDWIVREIDTQTGKSFLSIFFMLREGDVKTAGRLLKFSRKDGWETVFGIGRVYGIYQNDTELYEDVLPNKFEQHVYFSSLSHLGTHGQNHYFYKRTSTLKVEGASWEHEWTE